MSENKNITAEGFCKLHSSFHGEEITDLKQLTYQAFSGEELFEFINFVLAETQKSKIEHTRYWVEKALKEQAEKAKTKSVVDLSKRIGYDIVVDKTSITNYDLTQIK